jgi:DNA-binding transcriptional MerR regulator
MTQNTKEMMNHILDIVSSLDHIRPEDLPSIDLYMDQVTTFMETELASTRRYPDDKIMTKTMINNYTKNHLLPSPDKKRYSREHMLLLIFIYYFKNILSINDIQSLLEPLTEKYFHGEDKDMAYIYNEVFRLENRQIENLKKDLLKSYQAAETTFSDAAEEERDYLIRFSFICLLSFDVYVKKMLIEHLIDDIRPEVPDKKAKKADKKKKES